VQREAVADRAHRVLADAKAQVALGVRVLLEVAVHLHQRHVGGGEVGRASEEACFFFKFGWGVGVERASERNGERGKRVSVF